MTNKEKENVIKKHSKTKGYTVTGSICVWRMDAFKLLGTEESSKIFSASKGNFAKGEERITTK